MSSLDAHATTQSIEMDLNSSYIFSFNRVNYSYDFVKYDEITLQRDIQHLNTYITTERICLTMLGCFV